ncbi:hypothetical protein ABBQ38_015432 [Trebouxia sp. C0009 RCD-2024]
MAEERKPSSSDAKSIAPDEAAMHDLTGHKLPFCHTEDPSKQAVKLHPGSSSSLGHCFQSSQHSEGDHQLQHTLSTVTLGLSTSQHSTADDASSTLASAGTYVAAQLPSGGVHAVDDVTQISGQHRPKLMSLLVSLASLGMHI